MHLDPTCRDDIMRMFKHSFLTSINDDILFSDAVENRVLGAV